MVNGDTALGHHLLKIPQAQIVSQIPPNAEQDHGFVELPALEHCVFPPLWPQRSSGNSETKSLRHIPTGGIIIVLQTLVFLAAFFLAPKHGLLAARRRMRAA